MNATPNSFQNFNSLSLNYLKFITPKIWVLQWTDGLTELQGLADLRVAMAHLSSNIFLMHTGMHGIA
jgi:hypothetical protein